MTLSSTSASMVATYNHHHQLDAEQRSRLIHTSRKLGKLLGTTPIIAVGLSSPQPLSPTHSFFDNERVVRTPTRSAASSSLDLSYPGVSNSDGVSLTRSRSLSQASSFGAESVAASSTHPLQHHHQPDAPSQAQSLHGHAYSSLRKQAASFSASRPSLHFADFNKGSNSASYKASRTASADASNVENRSRAAQPVLRLLPFLHYGREREGYGHGHSASIATCSASTSSFATLASEESVELVSTDPLEPVASSSSVPPHLEAPQLLSPTTSTFTTSTTESGATVDTETRTEEAEAFSPLFESEFPRGDSGREECEARMRKRKMEKLMRHLGECVPSELVFGNGNGSVSGGSRKKNAMSAPASRCASPLPPSPRGSLNEGKTVKQAKKKGDAREAKVPMMTQVTHTTVTPLPMSTSSTVSGVCITTTTSPAALPSSSSTAGTSTAKRPSTAGSSSMTTATANKEKAVRPSMNERRTSVSIVSSALSSFGRSTSFSSSGGGGGLTYRKHIELPTGADWSSASAPPPPLPSTKAAATSSSFVKGHHSPSSSKAYAHSFVAPNGWSGVDVPETAAGTLIDRVEEEDVDLDVDVERHEGAGLEPGAGAGAGEEEEDWNAAAYQDVVKRLRALKA